MKEAIHPMEGHNEIQLSAQGRLVLEKSSTIKRRLKQRFDHIPKGDSLADELISERRVEARREVGE